MSRGIETSRRSIANYLMQADSLAKGGSDP
jgi:hypothetical protein